MNNVLYYAAMNHEAIFGVANTKLYVTVVTLSTDDDRELLQQLKSGFKRTINWNKYQLNTTTQASNRHLYYLIDLSFQGVNRLFVLTFDVNDNRLGHSRYYLLTIKMEEYMLCYDR